jgi:hypothetical protein
MAKGILSRLKIIAGSNITERRTPQDGRARIVVNGAEIDLRFTTMRGESAVVRLLRKGSSFVALVKLRLSTRAGKRNPLRVCRIANGGTGEHRGTGRNTGSSVTRYVDPSCSMAARGRMPRYRRLLFLVAIPLLWVPQMGIATAQVQDPAGVAVGNPLAAQSLDRMSATRERPIFSPSRRPPAPPPQPIVRLPSLPPPPAPPSLTLFGIVLEADEARALIRVAPKNDILRLRIGEEIDGWKVSQIERRRLVLSHDDRSATFTLFSGQGPQGPIGRPASRAVDRPIPIQMQPPIPAPR